MATPKPAKPKRAAKAKAKPKKAAKPAKAKAPARRKAKAAVAHAPEVLDDDVPLVTLASDEELESEPAQEAAPRETLRIDTPVEAPLTGEWSLPEQFFAVALHDDWDDRMEKPKVGRQGAALVASVLLELAVRGRLRIHLDRLQVVGEPTGDHALDEFANVVAEHADEKAPAAIERMARRASRLLGPWRGRLHRRGVAREESWRFLGILPRSRMLITDPKAKAKLENRLQRTLVGGTPDARTILLLGLIDAAGLLPEIIPEGALAFNRKRIHALLAGRDPLGYRVDPGVHDLQSALVSEILRTVRTLQGVRD